MNLNVVNVNGKFLVDSREVAEMTEKKHKDLMRDIRNYSDILLSANLRPVEFFEESSYSDKTGRTLPCYLLTRKGCDLVANKMTGEKGVLFTAAYVTKFEEMEKRQQNNVEVLSERQALIKSLQLTAELAGELEEVKDITQLHGQKLIEIEAKVDEQITLDSGEQRSIQRKVAAKIYSMTDDRTLRAQYFRQLYREIKDRWAVPSYRDVRRTEIDGLINYIEAWRPVAS